MAPPSRPPTLAKSAKLLFSCSAYSSVSGSCQARSSARTPASTSSRDERVVVAHDAGVMMPERHDASAGQRRDVDHGGGLEAARVVKRIAQDQPAFGVGVEDLHRLPGGAGGDVAGLDRLAARHVLDGGDEADDVAAAGRSSRDETSSRRCTAAAPLMSNFISSMAAGSLSEMPPVSKVTPLPTSTTRRLVRLAAAVLEHDEARRLGAALRHRQQAAHLLPSDRRPHRAPARAGRCGACRARAPARPGSWACRRLPAGWRGRAARCTALRQRRRAPGRARLPRHRPCAPGRPAASAAPAGLGFFAVFRSLMR